MPPVADSQWWSATVPRKSVSRKANNSQLTTMKASLLWILLVLLVCRKDTPHLPEPPECPRVLKRQSRTRISTVNCRTLLDDSRLDELDSALSNKHIDICALQEIRRDGFYTTNTSNYCIYTFGECSGYRGVGFAVHNISHLIEAVRGVPETDGRIILLEILLSDNKQSTTSLRVIRLQQHERNSMHNFLL